MTELIRVLVGYQVDADYGGSQHTTAREVLVRLDPTRFHVTAFYDDAPDERLIHRPNTRLVRLPERRKSVVQLRHLLARRYDRLFYWPPMPATYTYLRLRPRRNRLVTSVEGQLWHPAFDQISGSSRRQAYALLERSQRCTAVSHDVAEAYAERFDRPMPSVATLGVDTARYRVDDGCEAREPLVLFAGNLQRWKRPELVVEAAARFPDHRFVLAGRGPLEPLLRQQVAQSGLRNVELVGYCSFDELRALYRRASVFLFPSISEGMPKVLLEAAASGLPIVTCGDYRPEAVRHGETGYATADAEDMFAALGLLLGDDALRGRMSAAAVAGSCAFDWDEVVPAWAEAIAAPF
ncbi:MAG: putative glycosyltransferase [Actinomycetia bacterium]|nr:putative glycosyltransferase [Actinomycetes bacterium]